LRAPAIRRELGLQEQQVESVQQLIDQVDEPLWRLRDAQFLKAENATKAWQLIDRFESKIATVLEREQHAQLRQFVVRARGFHSLLSRDVVEAVKLSPDQVRQIAGILEDTRKEVHRLQKESVDNEVADLAEQSKRLAVDERKKVLAILTDDQKRRWQRLAGSPYDFSQLPRRYVRAPEIRGVDEWINSAPLALADLRGKVVALHFFTFGCINCVHNQPAYKDWHERFPADRVLVLGVHTPEGEGDRKPEAIRKAIQDQGIAYPVAVDNKKENWTAWANHTWPSVYLIDKGGYVRYWWYGELNWKGARGEKLYREKIAELAAERSESRGGAAERSGGTP
jgi:peroxiredoxin